MADDEAPGPEARKEIAEFTLQICKPLPLPKNQAAGE
jgi:hypothetical protein